MNSSPEGADSRNSRGRNSWCRNSRGRRSRARRKRPRKRPSSAARKFPAELAEIQPLSSTKTYASLCSQRASRYRLNQPQATAPDKLETRKRGLLRDRGRLPRDRNRIVQFIRALLGVSPLKLIAVAALALALPNVARAGAWLVGEADAVKVLQADNATMPWYPASVTKIMTAYVTLKAVKEGRLTLEQTLTVSPVAASQAPSKMGFKPGTQ